MDDFSSTLFIFTLKVVSTRTWYAHFVENRNFPRVYAYIRAGARVNNVGKLQNALDERGKKCYDSIMDNISEFNQKVAKNLIAYRKAAGLTQAEVAEKIHYSDKSVSKWESGNGIPDVYTLVQLAELYGVSINAFLGEENKIARKEKSFGLQILIMLLSSGIVWLAAIFSFAILQIVKPEGAWWMLYLYAVLANAIVMLVYASIWKRRIINFLSVTTIVWMGLVCCYFTIYPFLKDTAGLWCIFLVGVPLQVLEILWVFFRRLLRKQRGMSTNKAEKIEKTETEIER